VEFSPTSRLFFCPRRPRRHKQLANSINIASNCNKRLFSKPPKIFHENENILKLEHSSRGWKLSQKRESEKKMVSQRLEVEPKEPCTHIQRREALYVCALVAKGRQGTASIHGKPRDAKEAYPWCHQGAEKKLIIVQFSFFYLLFYSSNVFSLCAQDAMEPPSWCFCATKELKKVNYSRIFAIFISNSSHVTPSSSLV